jgi:hypothetical protein
MLGVVVRKTQNSLLSLEMVDVHDAMLALCAAQLLWQRTAESSNDNKRIRIIFCILFCSWHWALGPRTQRWCHNFFRAFLHCVEKKKKKKKFEFVFKQKHLYLGILQVTRTNASAEANRKVEPPVRNVDEAVHDEAVVLLRDSEIDGLKDVGKGDAAGGAHLDVVAPSELRDQNGGMHRLRDAGSHRHRAGLRDRGGRGAARDPVGKEARIGGAEGGDRGVQLQPCKRTRKQRNHRHQHNQRNQRHCCWKPKSAVKRKMTGSLVVLVFLVVCATTSTRATLCVPPAPTLLPSDVPLMTMPPNATSYVASSCAAAEVRFGVLPIRVRGGHVVPLLCHASKEYLVLPQQSADANVAALDTRLTHFCAIRLDPATLLVDVADFTFAESDGPGATWPGNTAQHAQVPFGVAGDCRGGAAVAHANVDLRGTPFAVVNAWFAASGSSAAATFAAVRANSNRQVVDIQAAAGLSGACGWIAPGAVFDMPGGAAVCTVYQWQMQLQIARPPQQMPALPPCDVPMRASGTFQCRDRALPPPQVCPSPPSPPSPPFPGRTNATVHVACPPLPPPDMRTTPYPSSTPAFASCNASGVGTGLAMIRVRGGNVVQLFCSRGREYLILPNTVGFSNYGQMQTIFTFFCAIRLDPVSLLVDVGDLTFSSTEGAVSNWNGYDRVAYGNAGDCTDDIGRAKVDLRSTPFAIDESARWTLAGHYPQGDLSVHSGRQVADVSGDGFCGYHVPGEVDNRPHQRLLGVPVGGCRCASSTTPKAACCRRAAHRSATT